MLWLFGVVSAALQVLSYLPYLRDIVTGTTRPHRGTWAIWCTLSLIVLLSQRADGARWSLLMAGAQLLGTVVILVLSIRRGVGGTSRIEMLLLLIAASGVVGWYAAGDPTIATLCVVLSDLVAVVMMMPKTYADPYSETLSTYILSALSALCALFAVGSRDFGLVVYPAYIVCADLAVVAVMLVQRPQIARDPYPAE
jgi:hypothetical protein